MEKQYTRQTLLTAPQELQQKLANADLCIVDTRPAEDYARGHIPGAAHFDLFGLSLVDTTQARFAAEAGVDWAFNQIAKLNVRMYARARQTGTLRPEGSPWTRPAQERWHQPSPSQLQTSETSSE